MDARKPLLGTTPELLQADLQSRGAPKYRAGQVLAWVYERGATSFDEMSDLPKALRADLAERYVIYSATLARTSAAEDGTEKLLLRFPDGAAAETVWIPEPDRHTVCVSSQVGCPVGCRFCASGLDGVERNLTAAEIVEQAMWVRRRIAETHPDARLSNIVLMGMGEPLANYRPVVAALRTMNARWGLGIGARKITLSTVGLPKQIRMLAEEDIPLNLALSLHAPDDALRAELIPWAERVRIDDLLSACRYYFERTGREITLEYVLLAEVNDQPRHAVALADIARKLRANINLLRYNPVAGTPYRRPTAEESFRFQKLLRKYGANSHIRRSRGRDVDAACGQLRRAEAPPAAQ